jgi:4-hydroxy-tetrahydrodipicolinate synthase
MQAIWPAKSVLESGIFVQKLKYGCELQGNPAGECRMPYDPLTDAYEAACAESIQLIPALT